MVDAMVHEPECFTTRDAFGSKFGKPAHVNNELPRWLIHIRRNGNLPDLFIRTGCANSPP